MFKQSITALSLSIGIAAVASDAEPSTYPDLPAPITSFGACVADGWVYVYGGHTGEAHKYSLDTTLFDFRRLRLDGAGEWQDLPGPARAQGASLVPFEGHLIRVGGLSARNETIDQDEDLVSLTDVASFDPATQRWTALPDLPAPRSSHDSVIVGSQLYVLGGWQLAGSRKGTWLEDAWVLDLSHPERGWETVPQPFKRRAVAVEEVGGWIAVMGGMDQDNDTSLGMDLYNVETKTWSKGPRLPDGPMDGFGAAACVIGNTLYVTTYLGKVLAWTPGASEWTTVGDVATNRFFHRMLPVGDSELLLIGGASRKAGHLSDLEIVAVPAASN